MKTYAVPARCIDRATKILNTQGDTLGDVRDALREIVAFAEVSK